MSGGLTCSFKKDAGMPDKLKLNFKYKYVIYRKWNNESYGRVCMIDKRYTNSLAIMW